VSDYLSKKKILTHVFFKFNFHLSLGSISLQRYFLSSALLALKICFKWFWLKVDGNWKRFLAPLKFNGEQKKKAGKQNQKKLILAYCLLWLTWPYCLLLTEITVSSFFSHHWTAYFLCSLSGPFFKKLFLLNHLVLFPKKQNVKFTFFKRGLFYRPPLTFSLGSKNSNLL